ncbi:MAG: S41 family peptidase [Chloroflexota bacterium]
MKQKFIDTAVTVVSMVIMFAAGYYTNHLINPPELDMPVLSQAREVMENHAWYPVPPIKEQEYGMIAGLVASYDDPYASFIEPYQHELYTDTFQGSFGGIGSEVTKNQAGEILLYPFPDSPANEAGIEDGDRLVSVEGTEITEEDSLDSVVSMLRGPVGQKVSLSVYRPSQETTLDFKIKRQEFALPSVTWRILEEDAEVGLIRVNLIADTTPDEIQQAVEDLSSSNASKFILDLRGNGGGLLEAGVEIARLFLEKGTIIEQQYAGSDLESYKAKQTGDLAEIPLVVLIDHSTASASEIIAGALQQQDRAILIGTPSFGKNEIQYVFKLQDDSSIHVTAGKWWLPGEESIEDFFLSPDIVISPENYSDSEHFLKAIEYFSSID